VKSQNQIKAKALDISVRLLEALITRRYLNRISGYLYWRTRGENLDDPERNGEYFSLGIMLRKICSPNGVYVDVGANMGDWSYRVSKICNDSRIVAFEPASDNFEFLTKRFKSQENVTPINCAVSDTIGLCTIVIGGELSGSNSVYRSNLEIVDKVEETNCVSLDAFAKENGFREIEYIKIDVEGHELSVLKGATEILSLNSVRFLQWEYNKTWLASKSSLKEVFELLQKFNYQILKLRQSDCLHYPSYTIALDNYCYSNWIAVRSNEFDRMSKHIKIISMSNESW
jgi:FkbM family methyltransferase